LFEGLKNDSDLLQAETPEVSGVGGVLAKQL